MSDKVQLTIEIDKCDNNICQEGYAGGYSHAPYVRLEEPVTVHLVLDSVAVTVQISMIMTLAISMVSINNIA